MKFRASSTLLLLIFTLTTPPPSRGVPNAPAAAAKDLSIAVSFVPHQKLRVTFQNDSLKPLVLNLGFMLGNVASLFPSHLSIVITDSKNQSRSYHKTPGFIGGRADDWLIPLAPGDAYSLSLSPEELKEEKTLEPLHLQPGAALTAHFTGADPAHNNGNSIIPALPIWKGSADSPRVAASAAISQ